MKFEDIAKLDDRAVQLVLREVETKDLISALKIASDGIKERVFNNMGNRGALILKEEIELLEPLGADEPLEAQRKIVALVEKLKADGTIAT